VKVAAVVAAALAVLAVAAGLQARHDDGGAAHALAEGWRSVGAKLAGPRLTSAYADARLTCFRYDTAPRRRLSLCFDATGRLVESVRTGDGRVRLVSLSTSPGRAPVRVEPAAIAAARIRLIDGTVPPLRAAFARCTAALARGQAEGPCRPLVVDAFAAALATHDTPPLSGAATILYRHASAIDHAARARKPGAIAYEHAAAATALAAYEKQAAIARAGIARG